MAGGSAGGDGRRSVERRSRKVGRRRKPQVGRKVGPEGCSKAQAVEQQDGWPLDLMPIFSRRLSWKATPEGWQTTQVGNRRKLVADESRQSIGKRGRRVGSRRKPQDGPPVAGRRNTR